MTTRQRSDSETPQASVKKVKVTDAEVKVGTVTTFQARRGYGFISQDSGPDIFVHQSQIVAEGDGFRVLNVGQKVEFTAEETNGKWKATRVTAVGGGPIPTKAQGRPGDRNKPGRGSSAPSGAELQAKVTTQVEYYLSDKNLSRDLWMRAFLIKDNCVAVSNLLKCNKLKALTKSMDVIRAAVGDSKCLHMCTVSEEGSDVPAIARGPNAENVTPVPEYTPPQVLLLTGLTTGDGAPTWKDVRAGFLASYSAQLFVYISHETPFVVVNSDNKEVVPRAIEGGIKSIEGKQICALEAVGSEEQGEALLKHHYTALSKPQKKRRDKRDKKGGRTAPAAEGPVKVGSELFECQQDVYDKVKGIMKQYKNSAPLLGEDKKFMMTLLKAHPRASEKLSGVRQVIIKENAKYEGQSRCFFTVNKDNAEEDISYVKCIRNLPPASS